ncbi:MAG TPA: hypothetical protein VNS83_00595, partial [Lapillicoccus sp.]|nr:hypothetical protein [Lapillicoccus sp.]
MAEGTLRSWWLREGTALGSPADPAFSLRCAVSVVALLVHGVIALVLLNGTVHRTVAAGEAA